MTHQLFIEIDKFDKWARLESDIPQDERGGEWECDYSSWGKIYDLFEAFINESNPDTWSDDEKERLLYIIARDNEMEILAEKLSENALIVLANESLKIGHKDDKWQLAVQLQRLTDKKLAIELLEKFINDDEEYVNRRALLELAKLKSDRVEYYCDKMWNKDKYGDLEEYQRIAVLNSLYEIDSMQLDNYIEFAKIDGREYLIQNANEIERKIKNRR